MVEPTYTRAWRAFCRARGRDPAQRGGNLQFIRWITGKRREYVEATGAPRFVVAWSHADHDAFETWLDEQADAERDENRGPLESIVVEPGGRFWRVPRGAGSCVVGERFSIGPDGADSTAKIEAVDSGDVEIVDGGPPRRVFREVESSGPGRGSRARRARAPGDLPPGPSDPPEPPPLKVA